MVSAKMASYEPQPTPTTAAPMPGGTPAMGGTTPMTGAGTDTQTSKKIAEGVNEEYHDPYDDWSSRDTLLALIPTIMAFALQDGAFRVGLIIAVVASAFLLVMRTVAWDSRYKKVWPMLELISLPLYAILLGLSFVNFYQINKWFPTIAGITLAFMTLLSLLWRRPWTAHYARYPKFDRGGSLLWRHTPDWRQTSDLATGGWFGVFVAATCLTLIPQLTGHHRGSHALNIIFNYIFPALAALAALIHQQMLGNRYRNRTVRNLDRYFGRSHLSDVPGAGTMGTGGRGDIHPAGPETAATAPVGAGNV